MISLEKQEEAESRARFFYKRLDYIEKNPKAILRGPLLILALKYSLGWRLWWRSMQQLGEADWEQSLKEDEISPEEAEVFMYFTAAVEGFRAQDQKK